MTSSYRGRVSFVWQMAVRFRYAILACWATSFAAPTGWTHAHQLTDYDNFVAGGRGLLGWMPHFHPGLHVYAQAPWMQIGPPPLLLAGLLSPMRWVGQGIWAGLIVACGVVAVRGLERTLLNLGQPQRRAMLGSFLAGLLLLTTWRAYQTAFHLEDAFAVAATVCACAAIAARRPWWVAAVLIGTAAAGKPWAIVALPLLFVYSRPSAWRATLVAGSLALLPWVPFLVVEPRTVQALAGFNMPVLPSSALASMHVYGLAPNGIRTLSIVFGLAVGSLAVVHGKWLAVPMVALAGRLILEPRYYYYYAVGPIVAALLWDLSRGSRLPRWTLATLVVHFAAHRWLPAAAASAAELALGVIVIAVLALAPRTRRSSSPRVAEEALVPAAA